MKQKGRKQISDNLLDSEERKKILNILSGGELSISQLSDKLKMNRGTLKHHLSILIRNKFLIKQQQKHLPGKPVMFRKVSNLKNNNNELIGFLRLINKKGFLTLSQLKENNLDIKYSLPLVYAQLEGLIDKKIFLTPKGNQFLKENPEQLK